MWMCLHTQEVGGLDVIVYVCVYLRGCMAVCQCIQCGCVEWLQPSRPSCPPAPSHG